jgi:hypothetical protein
VAAIVVVATAIVVAVLLAIYFVATYVANQSLAIVCSLEIFKQFAPPSFFQETYLRDLHSQVVETTLETWYFVRL